MNANILKKNQFTREIKSFDEENFMSDLSQIEWNTILQLHNNDPNISFDGFQMKINTLIDEYLPLHKMTKKEINEVTNHGSLMKS